MASYEVQTEGGTYQVDTEDGPETSTQNLPSGVDYLKGVGKNLLPDASNLAKSAFNVAKPIVDPLNLIESAKSGSLEPTKDYLIHAPGEMLETAKNVPSTLIGEGKRIGAGELLTGHPINAVKKLQGAFYDKPLTTGLDLSPFIPGGEEMAATDELSIPKEVQEASIPESAPKVGPSDLRSAIQLRGKTYVGEPNEIHADVINKMADQLGESPDTVIDAVNKIGDQGFSQNGKFLTRDEVRQMTGSRPEAASLLGEGKMGGGLSRNAPEAPPAESVSPEANQILKNIQTTTNENEVPPKGTFETLKSKIPQDILNPMQEVNNYLKRQYGKVSEKPGFAGTAAEYLRRYAQNMSAKNLGTSPLQAKQLGPEATRAVGQYAMDKGITAPTVGEIGMENKVNNISQQAGEQIGNLRKLADSRGQLPPMNEIIDALKEKLDPIYTKGIEKGQKGSYMKALEELKRAEPTHQGLADAATTINKSATIANKLKQSSGAMTDVANEISNFNNASIKRYLQPQEQSAYEAALKDYGVTKKIKQFMLRKESRAVAGRLGPGGGLRQIVQNFLDGFGYKAQAKIASKMADFIDKNPGKVSSLPSLFKEFTNQIEDIGEEIPDAFE